MHTQTQNVGIQIEVTDNTIRATYGRMVLPSAKTTVLSVSTTKQVEAPKGQRGALKPRGADESFEAYQTRILERRAQLAAMKRAARSRALNKVRSAVRESVDLGGNDPKVALDTAMSEKYGVISRRTSVATREDIIAILTDRFRSTSRPNTSKVERARNPFRVFKALHEAQEYALLQVGYWRRESGHGERMVCSRANPLYRIVDLSASRVPFPRTEGFGRLAFEPSGTQGERMQAEIQRTPVRSRVFDRNGILEGQYTSVADEMHWSNSYDRLTTLHPQPLPDKLFTHGPLQSPFTTPTPQGHGAFSVWPCAEVNS
jgi:hypothetical protein